MAFCVGADSQGWFFDSWEGVPAPASPADLAEVDKVWLIVTMRRLSKPQLLPLLLFLSPPPLSPVNNITGR